MATACLSSQAVGLLRISRTTATSAIKRMPASSSTTIPATIYPLLRGQRRSYHSPSSESEEYAILSTALKHVPSHGFTSAALSLGARDAGYLDASVNLFPRGPFDLVDYYLTTQRLALEESTDLSNAKLGVGAKVRALALRRLQANEAIIHRWQEVSEMHIEASFL